MILQAFEKRLFIHFSLDCIALYDLTYRALIIKIYTKIY